MNLDAVLFDAGGVLVLPDPTVIAPLLAPYGASARIEAMVRAHYAAMAAQDRDGEVHDDWNVYNHAYVRSAGVPADEEDEAAAMLARTRTAHLWRWPIESSIEGLRALHRSDVPIGVVSNAEGQIEAQLRRHKVCQVGDGHGVPVLVVVDSGIVGVAKPDPGIFSHAFDVLGIDPERVAYVGDSVRNDVDGARAAGLHPVHLDPYGDCFERDDHDHIATVGELVGRVRGRAAR